MAEVNYNEVGAEFGMSDIESKDLYDQWAQIEDPIGMDYPEDGFRDYLKKHYASSADEEEEEPAFEDSALLDAGVEMGDRVTRSEDETVVLIFDRDDDLADDLKVENLQVEELVTRLGDFYGGHPIHIRAAVEGGMDSVDGRVSRKSFRKFLTTFFPLNHAATLRPHEQGYNFTELSLLFGSLWFNRTWRMTNGEFIAFLSIPNHRNKAYVRLSERDPGAFVFGYHDGAEVEQWKYQRNPRNYKLIAEDHQYRNVLVLYDFWKTAVSTQPATSKLHGGIPLDVNGEEYLLAAGALLSSSDSEDEEEHLLAAGALLSSSDSEDEEEHLLATGALLSSSDSEDDVFGFPKLTLTPAECGFDEDEVKNSSSTGKASFHLEKAVGFTYTAGSSVGGLDEDALDEDEYEDYFLSQGISVVDATNPSKASVSAEIRGIDDILGEGGVDGVDDAFLTQFASMGLDDTKDYARSHSVYIRNSSGTHQRAVSSAMLKQAEQLVRNDASSRKGFFLVVPSEASCEQHVDHCAQEDKRAEFVKAHLLKQAGAVESAALFDRPWKSLSSVATEYKFPSERENTLVRTRDNRVFKIADSVEAAYQIKGIRKNIKVVYLAPEETARLV